MAKVNSYFPVEIFMKATGAGVQETATQFLNGKTETDMKASLSKINEMVSADLFGKMGQFIMAIMKMTRRVVTDGISTSVVTSTKGNSSRANKTATGRFGTTKRMTSGVTSIKAIGRITNAQVMGNTFLQMEIDTLDSFLIACSMEMGY